MEYFGINKRYTDQLVKVKVHDTLSGGSGDQHILTRWPTWPTVT